jgi:hypothetical protein
MWTNGDRDAIARYEALPGPLQLREFLALVDPEPTGWVTVLRSDVSDGVQSTLMSVLIEPDFAPEALAEANWSCDGLGDSWVELRGGAAFFDGLVA